MILAGLLVAPLATRQYDELAEEWPELQRDLEDQVDDLSQQSEEGDWPIRIPTYQELEDQLSGDGAADTDGDGVTTEEEEQERFASQIDTARELALRVFHVGIIFILAPIIAFYLLVDLPHIRQVMRSLVPERARGDTMVLARRLGIAIGGYFRGQLAVAFVVGTMASIGLLIIDLPFWLIVGMIAGLFNMIPLIGPWVGAVPGIVIAFTTGGELRQAVLVAVVMLVVQQIDNHFISPIVMQRAVKLHPAVVMLALLAGGTLGGFFGLLLAVPAAATLKIVVGHLWRHYVLDEPLDEIEARWEAAEAHRTPGGFIDGVHIEDEGMAVGEEPADPPTESARSDRTSVRCATRCGVGSRPRPRGVDARWSRPRRGRGRGGPGWRAPSGDRRCGRAPPGGRQGLGARARRGGGCGDGAGRGRPARWTRSREASAMSISRPRSTP